MEKRGTEGLKGKTCSFFDWLIENSKLYRVFRINLLSFILKMGQLKRLTCIMGSILKNQRRWDVLHISKNSFSPLIFISLLLESVHYVLEQTVNFLSLFSPRLVASLSVRSTNMETPSIILVGCTRNSYMQKSRRCVEKVAYPIFEGAKLNIVQMSHPCGGHCKKKFQRKPSSIIFAYLHYWRSYKHLKFSNIPKLKKKCFQFEKIDVLRTRI